MRLFTFLLLLSALAAGQSVGVLLRVQGDVKVTDAKGSHQAALAEALPAGSRLMIAKGAKASFLFCPQSLVADATGPTEVSLSGSALEAKTSQLVTRKIAGCKLPPTANAGDRIGGVSLRGDNPMVLHSPANASVLADHVVFQWMKVEGADQYRVTVKSDSNLLWETETKSNELAYSGPALTAGQRYRWSVTALQGEEVLSSASAWMKVLRTDEQQTLTQAERDWPNADDPSRPLAMAFVYEQLDMPDAALEQYRSVQQPSEQVNARIAELEKRLRLK